MYEDKGTYRFLPLLRSFSTAKLQPPKRMKDYVQEIRQIADQLTELGVKFEKSAVIGFILNGLPNI